MVPTSSTSVEVYVQAVTDEVTLDYTSDHISELTNVEDVSFGTYGAGTPYADVTLEEDDTFDLSKLLEADFEDLDGSEVRSITIRNTSGYSIVVNGNTYADGESVTIAASGLSTDPSALPEILIGGAKDFSGDLSGIRVTLNAQDKDADGYLDGSTVVDGRLMVLRRMKPATMPSC